MVLEVAVCCTYLKIVVSLTWYLRYLVADAAVLVAGRLFLVALPTVRFLHIVLEEAAVAQALRKFLNQAYPSQGVTEGLVEVLRWVFGVVNLTETVRVLRSEAAPERKFLELSTQVEANWTSSHFTISQSTNNSSSKDNPSAGSSCLSMLLSPTLLDSTHIISPPSQIRVIYPTFSAHVLTRSNHHILRRGREAHRDVSRVFVRDP